MLARRHRDHASALPLGDLYREVSHAARSPVHEDGLARERRRLMPACLKRVRFVVAQLDQELPRGEQRHRRSGGMHMIDAGRLEGHFRRGHADVLGIGLAAPHHAGREANHRIHFVADGEGLHIIGDRRDDTRNIRSQDHGERHLRLPFRRKRLVAVA